MAALPTTIAVHCPRCNEPIDCTLATEEIPDDERRGFHTLTASVPDLRERMTAHYAAAHS